MRRMACFLPVRPSWAAPGTRNTGRRNVEAAVKPAAARSGLRARRRRSNVCLKKQDRERRVMDDAGAVITVEGLTPEDGQAYYEAVKAKFAEARDIRLRYRPEGTSQYTSEFGGALAKYASDPYAESVAANP